MKRRLILAVATVLLGFGSVPARAQTYIWTGIGNGWRDQISPPNDGTANLSFGENVNEKVSFTGNFSLNSLNFYTDGNLRFVPASSPLTLTINGGIATDSAVIGMRSDLDKDIVVNVPSVQTWDLGNSGSLTVHGQMTGSGNLTVTGTNQILLLNNLSGNASTYSGTMTFANSASAPLNSFPSLVLWGAGSLGTGTLTFNNGGYIITHQAPTITNNLILSNGPLLAGQTYYAPIRFRNWDGPATTVAGSVTLANSTTILANTGLTNKLDGQFPNNTGSSPLPGPLTRYPVIFTGNIGETGGARSLNFNGAGISILAGTNTYTGGTAVGFSTGATGNSNGSVIFATQSAIPATGTLQSGLLNFNSATGYMGISVSAVPTPGNFNTFLNRITATSSGAVGLDTLNAGTYTPASTPATFSDSVTLTSFTTTATNGIRLGTATSVILTGTITPQLTSTYHFGNGGGQLYIQSNLINLTTATSVQTTNAGVALLLYLRGTNTYSGGTIANNGFIIFDGASAVPASGTLRAGGAVTNVGVSYLGFTEMTLGTSSISGGTLTSGLFSKFDKTNTWGVIGFDATNLVTPTTVSNLDLTGFNNGVFVGTTTAAVLTGSITPTTVSNASNAANTLRFTAANGGTLTVNSTLADTASAVSVVIGTPGGFQKLTDGTVVLGGTNTYSGGTLINSLGGITLTATNNSSFGTGTLSLGAQGSAIGLATSAPGLTIGNAINFIQAPSGTGVTPQLTLVGANSFTLSGNISGPPASNALDTGVGLITLGNPTPLNVTVSGNNSGYFGDFLVNNGTLTFAGDNSAGRGTVNFYSSAGSAAFTSTNPALYGLDGENGGNLILSNGSHLTIVSDNPDAEYSFNGTITGPGNVTSTGDLIITSSIANSEVVYLYGSGDYSGGTTVTNRGVLALGTAGAIGSGTLTINSTDGGVMLNTGVTLTNALQYTQGGIAGFGTFAPTSVNGTAGGPLTIGSGQFVAPGLPGQNNANVTGKLTLALNTIFQNSGKLEWSYQDAARTDGVSQLAITGNLDLLSLSTGGFLIELHSYDANGDPAPGQMTFGNTYSFALITTTGTIAGFNPANFTIDATNFQTGFIPYSAFTLTSPDGQSIWLTFQAVPEPSTWVLLSAGLAGLGLRAWRRRRA